LLQFLHFAPAFGISRGLFTFLNIGIEKQGFKNKIDFGFLLI
jgi:hypothetical protein